MVAAGIVLIPGAPLGLLTTAVQALAGVLLPSASVFLLLLCNDREVLGPWVNPRWLNILAGIIIGVLLTLSGTLVVSTLFPSLNVARRSRSWLGHRAGRGRAAGAGGLLARPAAARGRRARPRPRPQHDPAGAAELADAAARPAQAGGMVARDEAGHAAAPRLPGGLGRCCWSVKAVQLGGG